MKLAELKQLPASVAEVLTDAKEGIVDALLNGVWQRVSGAGQSGDVVYGAKPSQQFVSGFLMPRYDADMQSDETSDIHISTIGMDLQVDASSTASIRIVPSFAIYVRVLPEWTDLTATELELMPRPQLRPEVEEDIRGRVKDRAELLKRDEEAGRAQQRKWKDRQQEAYKLLLAEHGVRIQAGGELGDQGPPEMDDDTAMEGNVPIEDARLVARTGHYIFDDERAARDCEVPMKWKRLRIDTPEIEIDLADQAGVATVAAAWSAAIGQNIRDGVQAWINGEGSALAFRTAALRPHNFSSRAGWEELLASLRKTVPSLDDVCPAINGVTLNVSLKPDLRDARRNTLRVLLENNGREVQRRKRDRFDHSIHQVSLEISMPASIHRPLRLDRVEPSYRFQDFLAYPSIGVNCGVVSGINGDVLKLSTTWMPRYQQPRIVQTRIDECPTAFSELGRSDFQPGRLQAIVTAYLNWIADKEQHLDPTKGANSSDDELRERDRFRKDLAAYRREAARIALGIKLLEDSSAAFRQAPGSADAAPFRAWLLLNRTFSAAGRKRQITSWRLFQLAFILAHVATIASRMPQFAKAPWFDPDFDEETATLLYFPTGGGKSEAFFGLLVFNLFLDRLRGKLIGVTAMIRYPLRLLTLQQAQRLLGVLVRAELIRLEEGLPGAPFSIGFWVGRSNTPNQGSDQRLEPVPHLDDSKHRGGDGQLGADYDEANSQFNKVPSCPICGNATGLRRRRLGDSTETNIVCFDASCQWNVVTHGEPLPFLIVDEDIYARAPAVLLGVIDKLALIGQHPRTIGKIFAMFGLARWRDARSGRLVMPLRKQLQEGAAAHGCEELAPAYRRGQDVFVDPFPSLIIQDEAHLLEESLGTFAGLFETMLEQVFLRAATLLGDRVARSPFGARLARLPKVVAATATVSVPQQQFGALYQRRHMHFPYPGTSLYESFYAVPEVSTNPLRAGMSNGSPFAPEIESPWMRSYASIMTNGKNHTVTTVKVLSAYHLAITEYWTDLEGPDGGRAVAERLVGALSSGSPLQGFHETAIRTVAAHSTELLATLLDLMRISLTYVTNKKGGDQVIDAFGEEVAKAHLRAGRSLEHFRTELISGGVDVATIQRIMRDAEGTTTPGQEMVGLDSTLRNIVATSAISHGVDVDKFNAMFFAGMPSDIAEFIQASSRVGRNHVGFSLLVPTPHARSDRYIVETHDIFHRFLERMIAPPAITRWAATAHDRVLASMFQAWLIGWVDQRLFMDLGDDDKGKARIFETVTDVSRLISGTDFPQPSRDFLDFAAAALGVKGRGLDRLGAAPEGDFYDGNIRNRAKQLVDDLRDRSTTTLLHEYWRGGAVAQPPMMSLRDVDEAGRFDPKRPFATNGSADDHEMVSHALAIVRGTSHRTSELDEDE